jgi:hypothetical protein
MHNNVYLWLEYVGFLKTLTFGFNLFFEKAREILNLNIKILTILVMNNLIENNGFSYIYVFLLCKFIL